MDVSLQKEGTKTYTVFANCKETDTIDGEKLGSIVGYAKKALKISICDGKDAEEMYVNYNNKIAKKIKSSEPCYKKIEMKQKSFVCKEDVAETMKQLIGFREPKFDMLIDQAAESATSTDNDGGILIREEGAEFVSSEFAVINVFKSCDNLEIIPSYMAVRGKKKHVEVLGGLLGSWKDAEMFVEYKHQKYILTKFDIKKIIAKVADEADKNSWSDDSE